MPTMQPTPAEAAWLYSTVQQFSERHPAFSVGGLRHQIFHEHTNGLAESGAINRIGRKILIHEAKFFKWVDTGNKSEITKHNAG